MDRELEQELAEWQNQEVVNVPSASVQMVRNCVGWLIYLKALLPFSGTLIGWRAGQKET